MLRHGQSAHLSSPGPVSRRRLVALVAIFALITGALAHTPATPATPKDHLSPGAPARPLTSLQWQAMPAADAPHGLADVDSAVLSSRAHESWSTTRGSGAVVALVDTGVAPVPALRGAVVGEVNFARGRGGDGYGHGTAMASLIAGRGPDMRGVAPEAGILSLKVADDQGTTDLPTVLRALDWLGGPGRERGVTVAVMALATESDSQAGAILDAAVDRLAQRGVLVITGSGNAGAGIVPSPASAPTSLSVGAVDDAGTTSRSDDGPADFSGDGPDRAGVVQPDVQAGGVRVVTSVDPRSLLARRHPEARAGEGLLRGSGTSMAAALAGGVAALVSAAQPDLEAEGLRAALTAETTLDARASLDAAELLAQDRATGRDASQLATRPRPHAARWQPARWAGGAWRAGSLAAARRSAPRTAESEWSAIHWGAIHWGAIHWGAIHWGALGWDAGTPR